MKIGIDISQIVYYGGVPTYTRNLVRNLVASFETNDYILFGASFRHLNDLNHFKSEVTGNVSFKFYPLPHELLDLLWNRLRVISIESLVGDIDIFHSSDWAQPKTKAKKVTTYHDVIPIKCPHWSHPKIVDVHKRRLALIEKEIDCVIAVSQSTKKDLLEVSKIPEEKIVVIYEGVDEHFRPQTEKDIQSLKKRLHLPDEFILAIGGVGSRRNLDRAKEAARDYKLIITGESIPRVEEGELPLLYASAKALLYPSLYEGFGLPILEAMACGTPVMTSNTSSMPEVGGDAAIYVNPENIGEISKNVQLVMKDEDLRKELIEKGFAQASKFSWKKCAEETMDVYKKISGF